MRSCRVGFGWLGVLVALAVGCAPSTPDLELWVFSGETMGTTYLVKVVADGLAVEQEARLEGAVQGALDEVNSKMSHYREDSEVSRFNRWSGEGEFVVSEETMEVLLLAEELSRLTSGAFDITVAPLVNAWGFGPGGQPERIPSVTEIEELLGSTGYEHLELHESALTVGKAVPELTIDLSAIAKGYGVDRVAQVLEAEGAQRYMVEVGGEVRARGKNASGVAWRIAIERPDAAPGSVQFVVPLEQGSIATSGDYRNYYEVDGERLSHMIDPRTGAPIRHQVSSVSVVAADCARADALATALLVLGPEGFDLAESLDLAAFFLIKRDDGFEERRTSAFQRLLDE